MVYKNTTEEDLQQIVQEGGIRYENGTVYVGSFNSAGQREGEGHLLFTNGIRYDGYFAKGLCNGYGVLTFPDGAKYEGEFFEGWIHGYGIFWRADGMKHEGEFRGGKICGLGLTTFNDGTNGFPKNEGYFENCKLLKKKSCPESIQMAQQISFIASNNK